MPEKDHPLHHPPPTKPPMVLNSSYGVKCLCPLEGPRGNGCGDLQHLVHTTPCTPSFRDCLCQDLASTHMLQHSCALFNNLCMHRRLLQKLNQHTCKEIYNHPLLTLMKPNHLRLLNIFFTRNRTLGNSRALSLISRVVSRVNWTTKAQGLVKEGLKA